MFARKLVVHCAVTFKQRLKTPLVLYSAIGLTRHIETMAKTNGNVLHRVDDILKSEEDKRVYRGLVLNNRMKVLLVSDPQTDKSAVAMDVNVGFLSDPDNLPGLAHFCEHMLFLGTEKYPNENDYSKFLSEHGGSSNAVTHPDHTTYYFDVVPKHLPQALDRFSQFFIAPLFTESATGRELNAVNSEHEKNVLIDGWRISQLERYTADHSHPYSKFGTGNRETLETIPKKNGLNVRDELLKFHDKWYSSNIMCLAILGKESLDELEAMVIEMFAHVRDKDVEAPTWPEHPFKQEHFKRCTYMVPVKDIRNLNILFPCPDMHDHYKSSPAGYISNLIGHEGPGSLLSALKARGWSNNLIAGYKSPNRGTGVFGVALDLTEEGLKYTDEIIVLVFQYLNMIRKTEPLLWLHKEQKDIASMTFRFKDKESPRSYISHVVHNLQDYPLEHVLCNYHLLTEWEPEIITQLFNELVVDNIRVGIVAKQFESEATDAEPWYGTKYKTVLIPETTLERWRNAGYCDELRIPDVNDFIPENFELYPIDKDATEFPTIIKDTDISRVWFKQDETFLLPKANLMFDFVSPLAYLDPLNCNLTRMFTQLFRDALNQYAYSADLAGLKWDLSNTKYGLILNIGGFSDKQYIFLEKIMDKMTDFKIDPKRFEIFKENYVRSLNNFEAEQPYQHAVYYLAVLLTEHSWTKQELLGAIDQVTIDKLEAFIPQVLSKMHIECLVHGNVNKQKALDLVEIVESKLTARMNMSPLLPRQLLLNRELKLEDGCNYVYEVRNSMHKSSCIELYYQCGLQSKETNVILELLAQIVQEPCFDILRTKEQLGYIVFSGLRRSSGVQGLRIIVQSEKHPTYVDERIEAFLRTMFDYLKQMSEEDFMKHRKSLMAQRLEKPKQLSMQTYLYWAEITSQQYHFDRVNVEVDYMQTITRQDVVDFFERLLGEHSAKRHKIGVHVISMADGGAGRLCSSSDNNTTTNDKCSSIQDVTVFKSSHGMHSLVQPYINITRKGNKSKL